MNIQKKVDDLKNKNHNLLLIIGQPGSGKSRVLRKYSEEIGVPIINLDTLFENTPITQLKDEMKSFLKTYNKDILLIDDKDILYSKDSSLDLLDFLKEFSQDITIVTTWNGKIEDGQLSHYRKNAPEDLIYSTSNNQFSYILC